MITIVCPSCNKQATLAEIPWAVFTLSRDHPIEGVCDDCGKHALISIREKERVERNVTKDARVGGDRL